MTAGRVLVFLILLLVVNAALCQTFQYSRGWTNGKRSDFPSADERFVNGDLNRLKMLVHGSADEQPLLFHCDFVDKQRKLVHADHYAAGRLRHEKEQNNDDNY